MNKTYYSLNNLDRQMEEFIGYSGTFFVELGANDGITQSNTLFFEQNYGWRGVLVEPIPHQYLRCILTRAPENSFFCNACVSFDYKEKFVEMNFSNLMTTSVGLQSDIDPLEQAKRGEQFLDPRFKVFSFGAVAKTLTQILQDANAPKLIDFLSLDVEGAELEVLSGLDHSRYRMKYILVESRSSHVIAEFLSSHHYRFNRKLSEQDYLFESTVDI